jgi:hypothetical protein
LSDQVIEAYGQKFVIEESLRNKRINHAYKLIYNCINHEQPEVWLSCTMQLIQKILVHPKYLLKQKISKYKLYSLYRICEQKPEYEYFFHTVKFLYIRLALKYLTLHMIDEALYLGIKTNLPEILSYCVSFANYRKDIVAHALLKMHEGKGD